MKNSQKQIHENQAKVSQTRIVGFEPTNHAVKVHCVKPLRHIPVFISTVLAMCLFM